MSLDDSASILPTGTGDRSERLIPHLEELEAVVGDDSDARALLRAFEFDDYTSVRDALDSIVEAWGAEPDVEVVPRSPEVQS